MQRPAYLWPSRLVVKAYQGKYETKGVPVVLSTEDFCESMRIDWPKTAFRPIGTEGIFAGLRLVSASAAFRVEVPSFSRPLTLST